MENLGLVGFTGAGANRLFSALTGLPAPSEYEAAVGIATVPDERLDRARGDVGVEEGRARRLRAGAPRAAARARSRVRGSARRCSARVRNCDAILVVLRGVRRRRRRGRSGGRPRGARARARDGRPRQRRAAPQPSAPRREERRQGDRGRGRRARAGVRRALGRHAARRARRSSPDDLARLAPVFCLTTKPTLVVLNTGEKVDDDAAAAIAGRDRGADRHRGRDRGVRARGPGRHARDVRRRRVGARHGRAGGVPPARPAHVPHDRRRRVARVDVPGRAPRRPSARA